MSALAPRHAPGSWCVLACALAVAAGTPAGAVVFRVGNDGIPPCTHTGLPSAVAAAAANGPGLDQIYLSDPVTLSSTLDINNQSVEIVGGFTDCSDNTPEFLTGVTMTANPGFLVHGGTSTRTVNLQDLQVIRSGAGGRILQIQDRAIVGLYSTLLSNGAAVDGANVWMSGPNTILYVNDSNVYSGDASGQGGGIYCSNGGTVLLDVGSRVGANTALGDGGGLYLDNCTMNAFSGTTDSITCPTGGLGIVCNSATGLGGGIYATNGASVNLIGGSSMPAVVSRNMSQEGGGAIFATGAGTAVDAVDTWITVNDSPLVGGAVYLRSAASFSLRSDSASCAGFWPCSRLAGNFSSATGAKAGALAIDSGADATVYQTLITANLADTLGSVAWIDGAGSTMLCEGCLVYANGGSLNDAFFETDNSAFLRVAFSTIDEDMGCCKGIFDTNNTSTVEVYSSILMAIYATTGEGKIFDDPIGAGEGRVADCILFQESTPSLPPPLDPGSQETIASAPALFAGLGTGDYRLRRGSQAEDFCDTFRYTPARSDLEMEARGYDDPTVPNGPFGAYDLGADEWRPMFIGDFEPGDCSQWSGNTGCA